jgi:hypothetical protein
MFRPDSNLTVVGRASRRPEKAVPERPMDSSGFRPDVFQWEYVYATQKARYEF